MANMHRYQRPPVVHIHDLFNAQMIQVKFFAGVFVVTSFQGSTFRSRWWLRVLTQVFWFSHSCTHLPICPISPNRQGFLSLTAHTKVSFISRWSGRESSETRFSWGQGFDHQASFHILRIYLFLQLRPVSEKILCSVSCSRTLQWSKKKKKVTWFL